MKILFFGDINGPSGLRYFEQNIIRIKNELKADLLIVNAENSGPDGRGITKEAYETFVEHGVDCLTMGNWTYGHPDFFELMDYNIIKPINILGPGKGYLKFTIQGETLLVTNLVGNLYMGDVKDYNKQVIATSNAFEAANELLTKEKYDYALIDFHAEVTGEKIALAYYLGDKVDVIVGTHTHVQTADERLLSTGCLFISDVGMCGAQESIIGAGIEGAINNLTSPLKKPKISATGKALLSYVLIDLKPRVIRRFLEYEK
ncbi:MAG: YmdB family metallophosphoesterase [Acholeplasmatales bacterium]|jgi:metallophosphoesterase (TIGR00282 family)|nr:YmdB family metallophosphoesterase [Acholeplasmatales bacterium]